MKNLDEQSTPEREKLNKENNVTAHSENETPKEVFVKIVREIGNVKLLKENRMFLLIVISNFFTFLCYFTPFTFIPIRAEELPSLKHNYAWIISIIGITNIPFRVLFGFLADRKFVTALDMNTLCIFIGAVTMFIYFYLEYFIEQAIFAVVFAIAMAGLNCLTANYLVEIVGSKTFANAFGILSIARGIGCMIGPYLTGKIYEASKSVLYPFLTTGISYTIAFTFTLIISIHQFIVRRRNKKLLEENRVVEQQVQA